MIARERGNVAITDREAAHGEAGERQIDRFIEHRSRQASPGGEEASERARRWRESEERFRQEHAEARQHAWITHHRRLATVHAALAAEHEQRAARLATIREAGP
jgi:hypothetical protein